MEFGKILKLLLVEHDLTQSDLALSIGFSQRAVSRWVNEESEPSETAIKKTAKFFGVTTDYLLGADEWTAEERAQGVIDRKKISVSADEETLIECYRTIGRKFGKKKQENFIKLAELYADEEG